jgi:hypothetical protein
MRRYLRGQFQKIFGNREYFGKNSICEVPRQLGAGLFGQAPYLQKPPEGGLLNSSLMIVDRVAMNAGFAF